MYAECTNHSLTHAPDFPILQDRLESQNKISVYQAEMHKG